MPGILGGLKFQAHVIFWVCIMKVCQNPCHVYCKYSPPPGTESETESNLVK